MNQRRRGLGWWRLLPIALAALYIGYQWMTADQFTNPVTGESHRVGMSSRQEQALGAQAFDQVLNESDLVRSGPEVDLVTRVAKRLVGVADQDADGFKWQVVVVRSDQANAFCLPGGKIVVYTGILPYTKTEAGLAAVMGHEMAHATARHGAQRMFQQNLMQAAMLGAQGSIADMDIDQQRAIMGALGAGGRYGVLLPFSRDHESEADYMGLLYMARAGYDPQEAVEFWKRMAAADGNRAPPEWASTHPSHGTRVADLQRWMPEALEQYRAAAGQGD